MLAVASGLCRHVLCFRTVWESTFATLGLGAAAAAAACPAPMHEWRAPFGAMSAANWIGMNANQYLHRYGATREMLGWIALNGRANAARNPAAIYRDPMTMDDYLSARPITTPVRALRLRRPLRRVDRGRRVRRLGGRPTCRSRRSGSRRSAPRSPSGSRGTRARSPTSPRCSASRPTCGPAPSLRPADVDLALVYDGFTFNAISWLEALGFCGIGEAQDWLDGGRRIALDGELPVNPHGGQLSEGRTHGFGFLYEAMAQLRHEAGERQVAGRPHRRRHLGRRHPVGRPAPAPGRVLAPPASELGMVVR